MEHDNILIMKTEPSEMIVRAVSYSRAAQTVPIYSQARPKTKKSVWISMTICEAERNFIPHKEGQL